LRDDNDEHPLKQLPPRNFTEFGIVRDDNDEHPEKQRSGKEQIAFGNFNVLIARFKILSFPFVISKFSDINQNDFD
jgi:hypothetical protein